MKPLSPHAQPPRDAPAARGDAVATPAALMGDKVSPEQRHYAQVLEAGTRWAFVCLLLGFGLYATGLLPAQVPLERLPQYWSLSARDFAAATGAAGGWDWARHLARADALSLAVIAFMAAMSGLGSIAVLPGFIRRREWALAILLVAQLAVLVLSASNVLHRNS